MTNRSMLHAGCAVLAIALGPGRVSLAAEPETYGATEVSYVRVPAAAFFPIASPGGYTIDTSNYRRWAYNGEPPLAAPVSLPAGARIVSVRFEFWDVLPSGSIRVALLACPFTGECSAHPASGAGPEDCRAPGRICSGNAFADGWGSESVDIYPDVITVDNFAVSYYLQVNSSNSGLQLAGIVIGYVLQVSPSPAMPTFNDVPTSHPFFQFVEALAQSGITAGCGGGNFCPNAPLTRGQMAVFLSKALGLQWP